MSDARPQRVLVTGGAGLIGSAIVDQLTSAGGSEIIVYDNLERGRMENLAGAIERGGLTFVEGDIRDRSLLGEVSTGTDVVLHGGDSLQHGPQRSVNAVSRHLADTRRAAILLGFRAEVQLKDGLSRLVEWWRAERSIVDSPDGLGRQ